jgi:hypothetical protein
MANSLIAAGYHTSLLAGQRFDALKRAIATVGGIKVLEDFYELMYGKDMLLLNMNVLILLSDRDVLRGNRILHLRDFGYSMAAPFYEREDVLRKAINAFGQERVYKRLIEMTTYTRANKYAIAEDLMFMRKFDKQTADECNTQAVLDFIAKYAPISLRKFGYAMAEPMQYRRECIDKAIKENGREAVMRRIVQVMHYKSHDANAQKVLQDDIAYCINKC